MGSARLLPQREAFHFPCVSEHRTLRVVGVHTGLRDLTRPMRTGFLINVANEVARARLTRSI